ncbi:hypothetical protein K438DRAFT_1855752 [Mycena galopus ATCC 62051]|nr:hypothetical protein K438DRAFT_1855752 [Mycena galopus ATCC 62051]
MDSVFPPELEREIFEVAALSDSKTIPSLLRVARRVLEWIEPLLYRVTFINRSSRQTQPCLRALRLKPYLLANGVRHLLLNLTSAPNWTEDDARVLLQLCGPRLVSFAGVTPLLQPMLLPMLHMSQLRRWAACLADLFGSYRAIDLSLSFFRTITHMDLFDEVKDDDTVICPGLAALPCLTHLCVNETAPHLIPRILGQCTHLMVLVLMVYDIVQVQDIANNPPTTDVRFIVSSGIDDYWGDWKIGVEGGTDFWVAADAFIAQRRRGEIQASCCLLDH